MVKGILNDVSLGYQLQWNAQRQVAGVMLSLQPHDNRTLDAGHLLATLDGLWSDRSVPITLCTDSVTLLAALLDLAPPALARIGMPDHLLQTPEMARRVLRASQRGLDLMWHGEAARGPNRLTPTASNKPW